MSALSAAPLRPPGLDDATAVAYKDWLHVNLFDHATGAVGLVNVSLHGAPRDERARAVGAALLHLPDGGWLGNVEARGIDEVGIEPAGVALERVALAVDPSGDVHASVRMSDDLLELDLRATPTVPGVAVEAPMRLGRGWISWYTVARLRASGEARLDGHPLDLAGASVYHDHNWGRWHWGDDLGWQWGAFHASDGGPAFVLARPTDNAHRHADPPSLLVYAEGARRLFVGESVEVAYEGTLAPPLRRVPGSMAALHSDRADPHLPATVRVRADDGLDRVELEFEAEAGAQLVTADPAVRGYGFINEIAGRFSFTGSVGGTAIQGTGLGMVERAE